MKLLIHLTLLITITLNAYAEVWLGKLKNEHQPPEVQAILDKHGGKADHYRHVGIHRLQIPNERALEALQASGKFEFLEPDFEIQLDATPNDPMYGQLWGMPNIEAGLAWNISVGSPEIVVAVIDTGIWTDHPDLAANIWTDPVTGAHGWTARSGVLTESVIDDHGHGTHTAGTIGAVGNNSLGVVGVNWVTRIAGFKFLGPTGSGSASDAILLYDKIIELKQAGRGNFRITSNSWGGGGPGASLTAAYARLEEAGILSCVSAGNSGKDLDASPIQWPAVATNYSVISVQAHDVNNIKASFSNWGYETTDISAPGKDILSTVPLSGEISSSTGYRKASGTSMSCPHMSGVAALALSVYPDLTVTQLKDLLMHPGSRDPMTGLAAQSVTGGRINAFKTLSNPYALNPVPNKPPIIALQFNQNVTAGDRITVTAQAIDPEGDPVHIIMASMDGFFTAKSTNQITFTAPALAYDWVARIRCVALDGRGGVSSKTAAVNIFKTDLEPRVFGINQNIFALSPKKVGASACLTSESTPQQAKVVYYYAMSGSPFSSFQYSLPVNLGGTCSSSQHSFTVSDSVSNAIVVVQSIAENSRKELAISEPDYFRVGNAPDYQSPVVDLLTSELSGYSPLTISYDLSGSFDPDGTIKSYMVEKFANGTFYSSSSPIGTTTLTNAGTHKIRVRVLDHQNLRSEIWFYATVFSEEPGTPPPPALFAPGNLLATRVGNGWRVTWQDTNTEETGYHLRIVSEKNGITTPRIDTLLPANSIRYDYITLIARKTFYTFTVWPVRDGENGPESVFQIRSK